MKTTLYFFLPLLLFFTDNVNYEVNSKSFSDDIKTEEALSLEGTWELVDYHNYVDNEVAETYGHREGYRQVKMFTKTRIMWSRKVPIDSTEYFGFGTYKISDGHLIESLECGSEAVLKAIDTMRIFSFELILTKDTYSQIEIGPEGDRIFSENYIRIE
ncbi:MAG: hypothetical protein HKO72_05235 [Flavobacteriaceae bacterium]|nr:hypothetical protein [Bacteroidia bacterium]NNL60725.1 hypothetical protein [Flavobacteriaceae bacterium]